MLAYRGLRVYPATVFTTLFIQAFLLRHNSFTASFAQKCKSALKCFCFHGLNQPVQQTVLDPLQ